MNSLDYQRVFHEIKNAVTLIYSSVQLLNSKCPQLKSEPYWENIMQETTSLKNMILEISQAGTIEQLQKAPLDLNSMLQNICRCLKDTFPALQWNLNLCENLPAILADSMKLRQAIINLIKNSAEADSTHITITTKSAELHTQIIITDFGGGVPAELENSLFELFTTSKKQGSGLGLPITKQIIENHGGTLLFENEPGQGCTFSIQLPVVCE